MLQSRRRAELPAVTEQQALSLEPGTLIWLKWESPGARMDLLLALLQILCGNRD